MKTASVATFKAELARFLRAVKRGDEVVVTERRVPVARVIRYEEGKPFKLAVRAAKKELGSLPDVRPAPGTRPADSLSFLLEERQSRR